MDMKRKEKFTRLWGGYFDGADLPMAFYYADSAGSVERVKPVSGHRCIFADLARVRAGHSLCFDAQAIGCFGGRRYTGFSEELTPNFEYFLSCGIPGKLEGERYKKTPELVKAFIRNAVPMKAPRPFIVFKRWDMLEVPDEPEVVIFFGRPDVLAGLFTLANYDVDHPNGVFCPFGAGCGSVIQYPYQEAQSDAPRAVLGFFDVSARPYLPADMLSFAAPMNKFERMMDDMEESFLITPSWAKIQKRIAQPHE